MKVQVDTQHYSKGYDSKERFISYWYQINEVLKTHPKNVLEIGKGTGLVSDYLKKRNITVNSVDIDKSLNPDFIGSVTNLTNVKGIKKNSFDTVLCAEVLEHIPFEDFNKSLEGISLVTRRYCIISLPHFGLNFFSTLKLPKAEKINFGIKLPLPLKHRFNGEHYWEIGKKGYSLGRIKRLIEKYFVIKKTYLVPEIPYHRFFLLEKKKKI